MTYKKNDRIALVHTTDPYTDLRPGSEGTVRRFDAGLDILHVAWDAGSSLSMLLDGGDEVRPA
ncbi:DUF4314 domain-containing protein [Streptomyces sp. NPDC088789]|uniref:DUF4314 domain-containing protein n=1 Tax=Streptomyces sp. NPDC088789 TaxID=3365899 RepID=UPI003818A729